MRYHKTTDDELSLILEEGEGYALEFKQSVNSDLSRELTAFANASGGRILIGVDDKNRVVGCDLSNAAISKIEDMAATCDPPVSIHIEKLLKHNLLVIHVPEGANRPHRCGKGFFLRNGASSQKMTTENITAFIQAEGKIRFDQQLRADLNWQETLDENRLNQFLTLSGISQRSDTANLLFNLGAGDYKDGQFYLNQTGVLFFSKDPTLRLFHVSVVCALFKGTGKAYILDRKELTGSIIENVDDALIFLKKHLNLRWEITRESTRRKEILELPEVALREAVINAVCHRDYNEHGAHVMIEVFDDRVEIYNPGGLPKGLPEKDFGKRSVCRNPNIAALLLRCDYIEKMGSGIERIRAALSRADCPRVMIRYNEMFTLAFPRPSFTFAEEVKEPSEPWTTDTVSEKMLDNMSEKILDLVSINPRVTLAEMADSLSLSTRTIERYVKKLQIQGHLKRSGSDKNGHWVTEKMTAIVSEEMTGKVSEKILDLISINPHVTLSKMAESIGVTTRTIERNVKKLQIQGRLTRIGPDKGGYWECNKYLYKLP